MTTVCEQQSMMISLPETTVARLLALRATNDESVADVVDRILGDQAAEKMAMSLPLEQLQQTAAVKEKYACELLGTTLHAPTLSSLFGKVIDLIDVLAPEVLQRLSEKNTTYRRKLSRERDGVHLRAKHLPVLKTKSGWWISKNVSEQQTIGSLRALCAVAGLKFGSDIRFLVKENND